MMKISVEKCKNCNEQLFGPVKYCPFCGNRIEEPPPPPPIQPESTPEPGPVIENFGVVDAGRGCATILATARSEAGLNVAAAEWFIGNDPGPGNGSPIFAVGGFFKSSLVDIRASIDVSQFKEGKHPIYVRSADARGVWGNSQTTILTVPKKEEVKLPEKEPAKETKQDDTASKTRKTDTGKKPETAPPPPPPPPPPRWWKIIIGAAIATCLIIIGYMLTPKGEGKLSVSTKPSGASLTIDGVDRGKTPQTDISVNSGTRHIVLKKQGYETVEQDVGVKSGENKDLAVNLIKTSKPPPPPTPPPDDSSNSADTEREIAGFMGQYFKDTESRDLNRILSHYGEQVDYFLKGVVKKDFIRKDKEQYFKRWTTIVNKLEGQLEIQKISQENTRTVRFMTQFFVKNEKQSITGGADNTWMLEKINNEWKIVGEKQRVLNRDKN